MAIAAIIVAAGSSRRMGFDKLTADLCGRPVLAHAMEAFAACPEVAEIIVVTSPERFDLVRSQQCPKLSAVIEGGSERHLSVWNGLQKASPANGLIAVHDGARPLIAPRAIQACAEAARQSGAAALAHRVVETLKRSVPGGCVAAESVSRENLWAMETPQIFRRDLLLAAYQKVLEQGQTVTDEVSAVQILGRSVQLVENAGFNPKITVPSDLRLAEAWMKAAQQP